MKCRTERRELAPVARAARSSSVAAQVPAGRAPGCPEEPQIVEHLWELPGMLERIRELERGFK